MEVDFGVFCSKSFIRKAEEKRVCGQKSLRVKELVNKRICEKKNL
jgi:hypothetical protein